MVKPHPFLGERFVFSLTKGDRKDLINGFWLALWPFEKSGTAGGHGLRVRRPYRPLWILSPKKLRKPPNCIPQIGQGQTRAYCLLSLIVRTVHSAFVG